MAMSVRSNWLRDKLMGSFMWPIVSVFLIHAITLPCVALISPEDRLKRILNAFSSLFNTALTLYLGLIPRMREKRTSSFSVFILALSSSFAAAVTAVVLAFFDGTGEIAASALIQLLLGPVQNYIFATVLAAYEVNGVNGFSRRGQTPSVARSW